MGLASTGEHIEVGNIRSIMCPATQSIRISLSFARTSSGWKRTPPLLALASEAAFEIVVPGSYRWIPRGGPHRIALGAREIRAGEVVELAAGAHVARFPDEVPDGMLVLDLGEPPGPAPLAFYEVH